jgi:hypothetical protein
LEYLDALREGHTDRATALIVELDAAVDDIDAALGVALGVVRVEVDPRIVALAIETESAIADIP